MIASFAQPCSAAGFHNGLSLRALAETIRGEDWIESQIGSQVAVSDAEVQKYYEQHQAEFMQPTRIRARHIFLTAPEGSAPELMQAKQQAILDIAVRLGRGEDFAELAAAVSENEASKTHGGDLGFFAANRMPAEFSRLQNNCRSTLLHDFYNRIWAFTRFK